MSLLLVLVRICLPPHCHPVDGHGHVNSLSSTAEGQDKRRPSLSVAFYQLVLSAHKSAQATPALRRLLAFAIVARTVLCSRDCLAGFRLWLSICLPLCLRVGACLSIHVCLFSPVYAGVNHGRVNWCDVPTEVVPVWCMQIRNTSHYFWDAFPWIDQPHNSVVNNSAFPNTIMLVATVYTDTLGIHPNGDSISSVLRCTIPRLD